MRDLRILVILAGAMLSVPPAQDAPAALDRTITIRLGHVMPPTHFEQTAVLKFAEDVARRSHNKLIIKVFPANQLGSEREQTESLNLGAVEMGIGGGAIQNYVPGLGVYNLPFIFRDAAHFDKVMDGPLGEHLKAMSLKHSNIRILDFFPNGERMFFNRKRALTKLKEFEGVKIRVDDAPANAAIWRAVGANPIPMAYGEVYTALQTGVVDAAENPPAGILRMKFYEVGKYVTITRHMLTVHTLMTNEKWWQSLPGEARQIIQEAIKVYVPERRRLSWEADATTVEQLKKLGAVVSPLDNPDEFARALAPVHREYGEKYGVTDLIEKIKATK
jgi:tripartite ATP-independent transporter DctP family solute receptor